MKTTNLLSTFLAGLSTMLPLQVLADSSNAAASPASKLDINAHLESATMFTNAAGMVLNKVGSLWVGVHEVTQKVYQQVAGANPSTHAGDELPVHNLSWEQAVAFCKKLTDYEEEKEMLPRGYVYALPTQDQWHTLASAVTLEQAFTSSGGSRSGPSPVGSLAPSKDGLYDLRGNVWEWCADPTDQAFRVLRGGSWTDWIETRLRLEFRYYARPDEAEPVFGFRCVLAERPKTGS